MTFWWATQNRNYEDAITEGSLWTCPRPNNRKLDNSRAFIMEIKAGDVVFHHAHGHVRAVSVVIEPSRDHPRPQAYYPRRTGERDNGWLVRVDPVATDLKLHYTRVAELIEFGRKDAPLHSAGRPAERYLSALTEEEGLRLLEELGVQMPTWDEAFMGRPAHWWNGQDTDAQGLALLRREQTELRRHLLGGRETANCSVCGESYPRRLLIAGHIKPRRMCTEEERRDFTSVAMLICSLGCDPLFEWGYITVAGDGTIRRGRHPETSAIASAVSRLIDRPCLAFTPSTATAFKEHSRLHSDV